MFILDRIYDVYQISNEARKAGTPVQLGDAVGMLMTDIKDPSPNDTNTKKYLGRDLTEDSAEWTAMTEQEQDDAYTEWYDFKRDYPSHAELDAAYDNESLSVEEKKDAMAEIVRAYLATAAKEEAAK